MKALVSQEYVAGGVGFPGFLKDVFSETHLRTFFCINIQQVQFKVLYLLPAILLL